MRMSVINSIFYYLNYICHRIRSLITALIEDATRTETDATLAMLCPLKEVRSGLCPID